MLLSVQCLFVCSLLVYLIVKLLTLLLAYIVKICVYDINNIWLYTFKDSFTKPNLNQHLLGKGYIHVISPEPPLII